MRRSPGKRKSDLMEQMFRAALLRKAKQANGQKPLEEMSNHLPELPMSTSFPMDGMVDNKEFWVHEECAAWSKTVYLFGHRLRGLEETVLKAVDKLCSRCKFPGASLSCAKDNCPELYHYLCARDNWCHMDEETYTIYCPQHKQQQMTLSSHCDDSQGIQNT
ncbi:retinoic acid-induced protein 1 [Trichonephila inaurata madagascariensis]|nr:retinoic acid-induced protein 1 [Trichonephila inaurata madagascariensis]